MRIRRTSANVIDINICKTNFLAYKYCKYYLIFAFVVFAQNFTSNTLLPLWMVMQSVRTWRAFPLWVVVQSWNADGFTGATKRFGMTSLSAHTIYHTHTNKCILRTCPVLVINLNDWMAAIENRKPNYLQCFFFFLLDKKCHKHRERSRGRRDKYLSIQWMSESFQWKWVNPKWVKFAIDCF